MYTVLIPNINPEGTYYLCNGYGGVATVKGSDITIHGHFVTDGDKTDFKIRCTYTDCDNTYSVRQVKKRNGNLLVQSDTNLIDLKLSWYNRTSDEHVSACVTSDLEFDRGVWICKDYEPWRIASVTDDEIILPYNSYEYRDGTFYCDIDSGPFAEDQVYSSAEDIRFYCRCHAVTDKSMAQHVRLTDEQLAEVNDRIKNLTDYCKEQGIVLVYDNESCIRAYKNKDLPEGYADCIDDCDNGNPQSMTIPWSGLRMVDLNFGFVEPDWPVRLNYCKPETRSEEADDE